MRRHYPCASTPGRASGVLSFGPPRTVDPTGQIIVHSAVATIPRDVVKNRSIVPTEDYQLASVGACRRPCTTSVLPLCFRRQPQFYARRHPRRVSRTNDARGVGEVVRGDSGWWQQPASSIYATAKPRGSATSHRPKVHDRESGVSCIALALSRLWAHILLKPRNASHREHGTTLFPRRGAE